MEKLYYNFFAKFQCTLQCSGREEGANEYHRQVMHTFLYQVAVENKYDRML